MVHQRSLGKKFWNNMIYLLFIYFAIYEIYIIYLWRPNKFDFTTILKHFFGLPYLEDIVVIITVCFYFSNLGCRFQILNDFWKSLPPGLVSSEWRQSEIIMLMESIRLLHAELSELLNIFNLGYGPMLLGYFVCSFIDMVYILYLMVNHEFTLSEYNMTHNVIIFLPLHILNVQIIIFLMVIIVTVSWINDKVQ